MFPITSVIIYKDENMTLWGGVGLGTVSTILSRAYPTVRQTKKKMSREELSSEDAISGRPSVTDLETSFTRLTIPQ